jgi:DNA polymerase/3'-5' exonuclease PolX
MRNAGIALGNGWRQNSKGKLERIKGFGLNKSAQIAQAKSKKVKVTRRAPAC